MEIRIGGMKIEHIDYRKLKPLQGGLKLMNERNYERLKKSLSEKNLFVPLMVWKNGGEYTILDGHGRERLFQKEQVTFIGPDGARTHDVPCLIIEAADLKDAKEKLLVISSQYQTITQEGFDEFIVDIDGGWLQDTVHFDLLNFQDDLSLGENDAGEKGEAAPAVPENPKTRPGDLWKLGDHLLLCGDSTSLEDIKALVNRADTISMVFTDPPYGISVQTTGGKVGSANIAKGNRYKPLEGDQSKEVALRAVAHILSLGVEKLFLWGANHYCDALPGTACWIVWDKENTGMRADCELAWTNMGSPAKIFRHMWNGMIKASEHGESRVHPTQKPVALAEWCFKEYGQEGDTVLDLFGGSGSTLIACERTGRKCLMMEIDPGYCDVIVERWEKETGRKGYVEKTKLKKADGNS